MNIKHAAAIRLLVALTFGLIACIVASVYGFGKLSFLIGWDVAVIIFIVWIWSVIWPMDHKQTAKHAQREDPSRTGSEIILLSAGVASLLAVGYVILQAHTTQVQSHRLLLTAIAIVSVVASWTLIHTIYTLRYATVFYSKEIEGSINFIQEKEPSYSDFAYFAFVIGMTYQVSDTTLTGSAFRRTVLRHSLLSYLFGTVIIATTISLVVNLGN